MQTVCELNKCAGCMACLDICPRGAIKIIDDLAAYNATIDSDKCVDCGLCHNVCPNNNKLPLTEPIMWVQGWAKKEFERAKSSSGGFATAIAKSFVNFGGYVCSCLFENGEFRFKIENTVAGVEKFRGSKYVKSNPDGVYRSIKKLLSQNNRVLFIGLPCQVAGVQNFVGTKLQNNLYTVDLICHGTPSPQMLEMYLLQDFRLNIRQLSKIGFREKTTFDLKIDKKRLLPNRVQDKYTMAFLDGMNYTENCYSCRYATKKRVSDLTVGDSWNSNLSIEEQKKGISLALCQNEKGKWLLDIADLEIFDVDAEKAIKGNRQLQKPSPITEEHNRFMKSMKKYRRFSLAVTVAEPRKCLRQDIKTLLYKLKILRGRLSEN